MTQTWRWLAAVAGLTVMAWGQTAAGTGRQQFAELGNFRLQNGQVIEHCRIGYRTLGKLNAGKSNAVLFPTWFTGTTKSLLGLVGPGKLVNSQKYYVILVDALGDGVSSSPSNSTAQPRMQFPRFTIRDMVNAEYDMVTKKLGLRHLHAVMGISMGGMQTFTWAVAHPKFMDMAIPIVGSPRLTAYDLMLWHTEIEAIRENIGWDHGNYTKEPTLNALTDIHTMQLTSPTYRAQTTSRAQYPAFIQKVEATGPGFDANNWIRQAQAMMAQNVAAPFGGSMARAAAQACAHMLIVPSKHDHMVNPIPALHFAKLHHAKVFLLTSLCGHLSNGCQAAQLDAVVGKYLATAR